MRKQYHFQPSAQGLLAWDIDQLILQTHGLPIIDVPLSAIKELDEPYWFTHDGGSPTCRAIASHAKLMQEVDLAFPIILSQTGRVIDGMHRVCRAYVDNLPTVKAVQFTIDPPPDYVGVPPDKLPY